MMISNLLCLLPIVEACGVAVHLELVDRILPVLPLRITQHYNYIRSGAFYPDAFYNCMGQYDVAEDAHWPPFLANGIELVRDRQKRGEDTSKLEAFLVGILSHQVSDVSWHSLGIFQGLLRSMAENEFDGDYDKAHSTLDIGGDMIQLSHRTVREEKATKWEYDIDDILALLASNGYDKIPASSIRFCMARGHAAYSAELRVAGIGFRRYARRSPMLFDQIESYFAGGMTDMHEQIEECIPALFNWFQDGVTMNPWKLCQVFEGAQLDPSHPMTSDEANPEAINAISMFDIEEEDRIIDVPHKHEVRSDNDQIDAHPHTHSHVHAHDVTKRSSYLTSHNVGKVLDILADIVTQGRDKAYPACGGRIISCKYVESPPPAHLEHERVANMVQPTFGKSLLFWGRKLVVGAPSEGRVYLYEGGTNNRFDELKLVLTSKNKPKKKGHFSTRFGAAMTLWNNYLAVSSPGLNQLDFYDTLGKWSGGIKWNETTSVYGSRGLKLIGESLATDNVTGKIYIGAPYVDIVNDRVHVPSSNDGTQAIIKEKRNDDKDNANDDEDDNDKFDDGIDRRQDQIGMVLALNATDIEKILLSKEYREIDPRANILYQGSLHYEQAGKSIAVTPEFVLVGAPGSSNVHGIHHTSGERVFNFTGSMLNPQKPSGFGGYLLAGDSEHLVVGSPSGSLPTVEGKTSVSQNGVITIFKNRRAQSIEGASEFDWFGSNGVIVGSNLYVASPHAANGKGALWKVDLNNPKVESLGSVSNAFASGFGSSIATNGEVLAIGMPYYGPATGQARRGAVAIVPISSS